MSRGHVWWSFGFVFATKGVDGEGGKGKRHAGSQMHWGTRLEERDQFAESEAANQMRDLTGKHVVGGRTWCRARHDMLVVSHMIVEQ